MGTAERSQFLPFSRFALLQRLREQPQWREDETTVERFLRQFAALQHQHFRQQLHGLKRNFLPFSPDRDTQVFIDYADQQREQMQHELLGALKQLLEQANYDRITADDLDRLFSEASPYGLQLKVDLTEFAQMLLYSRGHDEVEKSYRHWKTLFLKKHVITLPVYQRLFLLLKLKPAETRIGEIMQKEGIERKKAEKRLERYRQNLPDNVSGDHIIIKLFKNIPQADLEMLFPNTQVKLKPFDKLKLGVTAGGGTIGSVTATATKVAAAANPMAAAGALAGLAAVVFRQVSKFFGQRTKYMMTLAQNLYFHNLANNRAALTLLVDRAEEEMFKNSLLAWFILYRDGAAESENALRQRIEDFIHETFGLSVAFDIEAAISSLRQAGLIDAEQLAVVSPAEGCRILEAKWLGLLEDDSAFGEDDGVEA